jgi:hypothetical protein
MKFVNTLGYEVKMMLFMDDQFGMVVVDYFQDVVYVVRWT